MRKYLFVLPLHLGLVLVTSLASAQINEREKFSGIEDATEPPNLNHFGLSYRAGFNINASFKNLSSSPASAPGLPIQGVDHNYDNGYNRVDASGNAGGMTWNWGYTGVGYGGAPQVVNDTIVFESSRNGVSSKDGGAGPHHGAELTYLRRLGEWGRSTWGLEAAVNYTALNLRDQSTRSDGPVIVDTYSLGGITPPLAPYAGTFNGPGALISDAPNRLPVTTRSKFDADVYGLRLGPSLAIPIANRVAVSLSGGLALLAVNSDFAFQESVGIPGLGTVTKAGSGSHNDLLWGGYAAGNLSYTVSRSVNLFAGVQYQYAGCYSHREASKQAEIDFGKSIFLTIGVGCSF